MFPLRKVMMLLTVALLLVVTATLAAFGVGTAPVAAAAVAPAANWFTGVIAWMTANQVIVGALLVAVLDFIFAVNPQWKSNGALHMLYTVASKKSGNTDSGA